MKTRLDIWFRAAGFAILIAIGIAASSPFERADAATLPPAKIRFFETGDTQWIFVDGKFTFDQAMKMSTSVAITDPYGTGWLLAQMQRPEDFVNAAGVVKAAQGDIRDARGPLIGVIQAQGAEEPAGGFFNLDGSTPFMTWGKYDPNDGERGHRNILREQAFHDALKNGAQLLTDYAFGEGTSKEVDAILNFIVNEISKPEGGKKKDDVVALFHEKDGTVVAADVYVGSQYPVLLSRKKPTAPPTWGPLPSWPKVDGSVPLVDDMVVSRRSKLSWRWTGGARLGSVQVIDLASGKTVVNRPRASTATQPFKGLRPGHYLFRLRNISRFDDPWLEVSLIIR